MPRIWICQCLCPSRHCIVAVVGEADSEAEAEANVRTPLRRRVAELLKAGALNPWCGICNASRATWRYEVRRTVFNSMDEAVPKLREVEELNAVANLTFGDMDRSKPN
jgi:hypothetical protein